MNLNMNIMKVQLKTIPSSPENQKSSKRKYYFGVEVVTILTGVKTDPPKNMAIKMKPTIRGNCVEARNGANGS